MKENNKAILVSLIPAIIITITVCAMAYFLIGLNDDGVRTVEECNALKGTLGEDPNIQDWVKQHPNRANESSKQDCLDGRKVVHQVDDDLTVLFYISPIMGFISGFLTYRVMRIVPITSGEDRL